MLPFTNPIEHLMAELARIDLMVQRQVLRLRAARLMSEDALRGLYIPDELVDALLERSDQTADNGVVALTAQIEQQRIDNAARAGASARAGTRLPIVQLADRFGLSLFEIDVLLLCAAPELQLRYETLFAYAQNDITKKHLSVDLALNLLCPTLEEALLRRTIFADEEPLRRHHLIRLFDDPQDREPSFLACCLKADARIVDYLIGGDAIDDRLTSLARLDDLDHAHRLNELVLPPELIDQLDRLAPMLAGKGTVLFFHGAYGAGKQAAARALCHELSRRLLVADLQRVSFTALDETLALLKREALLQDAVLYLNHFEAGLTDEAHTKQTVIAVERAVTDHPLPIIIGSEVEWQPRPPWREAQFIRCALPMSSFALRTQVWEQALRGSGHPLDDTIDADAINSVADKFVLSAGQIVDAVRVADQQAQIDRRAISIDDLHVAASAQSNQALKQLAQKVEPIYTWSDIVLPARAVQQLREAFVAIKQRHVIYTQWGFERKLALGKGTTILFAGPSGTGKTMAAQILARELKLDLYKIDLSTIVSKYIGETEKNLARIFQEAHASNAILFFDEADALFGKRSEVKDAHDRYANIEVAYLLQRIEEHEGIVILATNLSQNIDEAFKRRMQHTIDFPVPDAPHRSRIWRGMFPPDAPIGDGIDFDFLARQFELSGGNIRNIALSSAFMAADDGQVIRMEHVIVATARELHKIGKLPSRADFLHYYDLIRERG